MKLKFLLPLGVATTLVFASCEKENEEIPPSIIGTYTYADGQLIIDGVETPCMLTRTQLQLQYPLDGFLTDLGLMVDLSSINKLNIVLLLDRSE